MPTNRIGLAHAVASTSQMEEASTAQVQAAPRHSDPPAAQAERAAPLDLLSALPGGPRHEIMRRLGPRSMARLGRTSMQMAADAREGMQAFLAARPRYDPSVAFGDVTSVQGMRAALNAVTHFPYPDDEDHDEQRMHGYGRLTALIPSLPEQARFEAFTSVLDHAARLSARFGLSALVRLLDQGRALPEARREEAFQTILPRLLAVHAQAQQADAAQQDEPMSLSPPLARAISYLPRAAIRRAVTEVAARRSGPRAQMEAVLHLQVLVMRPSRLFAQEYREVARQLARSANGVNALSHLIGLLPVLPDPQMRLSAFIALADAASVLDSDQNTSAVLVQLAEALPQIPGAVRHECGMCLLMEARDLCPGEQISVISAVREQATAIPNRVAQFIMICHREMSKANARLVAD